MQLSLKSARWLIPVVALFLFSMAILLGYWSNRLAYEPLGGFIVPGIDYDGSSVDPAQRGPLRRDGLQFPANSVLDIDVSFVVKAEPYSGCVAFFQTAPGVEGIIAFFSPNNALGFMVASDSPDKFSGFALGEMIDMSKTHMVRIHVEKSRKLWASLDGALTTYAVGDFKLKASDIVAGACSVREQPPFHGRISNLTIGCEGFVKRGGAMSVLVLWCGIACYALAIALFLLFIAELAGNTNNALSILPIPAAWRDPAHNPLERLHESESISIAFEMLLAVPIIAFAALLAGALTRFPYMRELNVLGQELLSGASSLSPEPDERNMFIVACLSAPFALLISRFFLSRLEKSHGTCMASRLAACVLPLGLLAVGVLCACWQTDSFFFSVDADRLAFQTPAARPIFWRGSGSF